MRDAQSSSSRAAWAAAFDGLDLAGLGWARVARSAPADLLMAHPDARPARVVRVDRGRMLLIAFGAGSLDHVRDRSGDDTAVVGDWVLVDPPSSGADGSGFARTRLPRDGVLARRRGERSTAPQVLAANVDLVLVAEALDPGRAINIGRVARLVAVATSGGAGVHVLLTGADRLSPEELAQLPARIGDAPATATSVVDGRGLDALRDLLTPGMTATVVGASGAGKSSIANALLDEPLLAVGDRRAAGTGRHTTSVSRLVPLPTGALLVDTPGIRVIGMHAEVDEADVAPAALDSLATSCRFSDCHHDGEPGCAVAAAIERGDLPRDAVATWRKLEREARHERARADARLRSELRSEWRSKGREVERARRRGEIQERRRS